jgi:hypothetical protein
MATFTFLDVIDCGRLGVTLDELTEAAKACPAAGARSRTPSCKINSFYVRYPVIPKAKFLSDGP